MGKDEYLVIKEEILKNIEAEKTIKQFYILLHLRCWHLHLITAILFYFCYRLLS